MAGLSERIKQTRQQHLLTQEEAADAIGISVSSYQRYEAGQLPGACNARAIAAWMGIDTGEMEQQLRGGPHPPDPPLLRNDAQARGEDGAGGA
jgi:transcriptional regulator with XRE-family HTH domain